MTLHLLRAGGVGVLVDASGPLLPRLLHWGADPGPLDDAALTRLAAALAPAVPHSALDAPWPFTLLPGQPDGWSGRPGVAGHRDGGDVFPRLVLTAPVTVGAPVPVGAPAPVGAPGALGAADAEADAVESDPDGGGGAQVLRAEAADPRAGVATSSEVRLEASGLLRVRHTLTNTGNGAYTLDGLTAVLPVPTTADEVLDLTGRWCRERSPQRRPFHQGTLARESRRGRTGHDATLLLLAGSAGFDWRHGEVWGVHVAWSGNHRHLAERLPEGAGAGGAGVIGGGELLLPGEVRLAPGESYTSPWVVFTWSDEGMDGASARVHRWMRSRPGHPRTPRPLVLNTWEAVYFDQDLGTLTRLAEQAAAIGVERFVLDDGWFGSRRNDRAGLGDWFVSADVWPGGLRELADRVRALGMDFGLWVEPEMVNPDSDLAREHPDWLLAPSADALPRTWRSQHLLDVAQPGAFAYLLERLSALVGELGIAYLKWDHNRDLHESMHPGADGVRRGGVHAQTLAVHRLLAELRSRHPGLEIESCASGGARVDLGILEHTDRVWASDCNDALERQAIQRWTGLLLPPELVGTHIGPPTAHTTHRVLPLGFRSVTALFGHAGLEWDVTRCTPEELAALRAWSGLYRELRELLHAGDVVRVDHPDPGAWVHGVVSADRSEAVFAFVRLVTSPDTLPGRLRFAGLDPERTYRVTPRPEAGAAASTAHVPVPWWVAGGTVATGAVLERVGLAAPPLDPAQGVVVHLTTPS